MVIENGQELEFWYNPGKLGHWLLIIVFFLIIYRPRTTKELDKEKAPILWFKACFEIGDGCSHYICLLTTW